MTRGNARQRRRLARPRLAPQPPERLTENLADIIWFLDTNLRWTYLSPSAQGFLGLPLQKLLQRSVEETFAPESLAVVRETLAAWHAGPSPASNSPALLVLDVLDGEGGRVPMEVLARPLYDAQGVITGYCGSARDLRPRRALERAEAVLSRLAKGLLECESLGQSLALASACAEDLAAGAEACALCRDPQTGLLLDMTGRVHPEAASPEGCWASVRHGDEELGRILVSGVEPAAWPGLRANLERAGALLALSLVRLNAEEALRRNERRLRKLLESMHEGVWAVDRDQRTIYVNEYLAAMLGFSVAELHHMRPQDLLDSRQLVDARERHLEHRLGFPSAADYEVVRKDGRTLPVHVVSSPILDESGGFEGLVCTAVDLSERKRMEETLRRSQARSEALYELSRLRPATERQLADFALREAMRLTQSACGALCFIEGDGQELLPMAQRGDCDSLPLRADAQPWRETLRCHAPLVRNQPGETGGRRLCAPAMDGDRPAAAIVLFGRRTGYTEDDGLQVSLLLDGMWRVVRGRRDEERIRASLREKEALLREVHHRVKNNLQVVSSLLDMAGRRQSEPEARHAMEEMRAKVLAMSLVHAQLHGEAGGSADRGISLERYVRALFGQLREIYSGGMALEIKVTLDELPLGLDQAAPLGLALNEILANAFKHARRADRPGKVGLRAWRDEDGLVRIEVRDDGPGLPPGFVPEQARSLGLTLMYGLVGGQLGGALHISSGPTGVLVEIRFVPK